jgi:hypothetical protein
MKRDKIDGKVRGWILRTHPEERDLIGDFDKDVTWREVARRMLAGECFYDICDCGESVQREYAFGEMARLFDVPYEFFYECWLHDGQGLDEKLKARVNARIATAK